jgi:hypothetical protein
MEALALGIAAIMGLSTYGLLRLCEWLAKDRTGDHA